MLLTLACSFIGCSISGSETHPSSSCTVWVATDTFFFQVYLYIYLYSFGWYCPRAFCLCCLCGSEALFNIVDYFFCDSLDQLLLQSVEAELFYIRLNLGFLALVFRALAVSTVGVFQYSWDTSLNLVPRSIRVATFWWFECF